MVEKVNATLYLPNQNIVAYAFKPIIDGTILKFGNTQLKAIHTPVVVEINLG